MSQELSNLLASYQTSSEFQQRLTTLSPDTLAAVRSVLSSVPSPILSLPPLSMDTMIATPILPISIAEFLIAVEELTRTDDHSNETMDQYKRRMREKAEARKELMAKELADIAAKKKEADADKHWTDKLNKGWPGAVGSAYELKL